MYSAGPVWLPPALEDQLVERFPGLSRPELRYAARLLDEGATPVDLIIADLELCVGGPDAARLVLVQLRVARAQHSARPARHATEHP
jgi:hypothetical protein